jgi:hypothetical protein
MLCRLGGGSEMLRKSKRKNHRNNAGKVTRRAHPRLVAINYGYRYLGHVENR